MPLIAVTPCRAMTDYLESLRRVGADPLELRLDADTPAAVVARVDGVLFTGGGDVDPALYGEAPHATFEPADPGRDAFEVELTRLAVEAGVPVFAICRGMQVVNVALGGTLVQDVPTMVNGAVNHQVPEPRYALAHEVWMSKESRLWAVMREQTEESDTCEVNSRHHQAVNRVAEGWQVSATAPDGVIEAMERPDRIFCLAVQWHPENFWRTGEFRPLFEQFVEAASAARP
jgi:putative glutamine amidotransferase